MSFLGTNMMIVLRAMKLCSQFIRVVHDAAERGAELMGSLIVKLPQIQLYQAVTILVFNLLSFSTKFPTIKNTELFLLNVLTCLISLNRNLFPVLSTKKASYS